VVRGAWRVYSARRFDHFDLRSLAGAFPQPQNRGKSPRTSSQASLTAPIDTARVALDNFTGIQIPGWSHD
jgi:hypothetical protein